MSGAFSSLTARRPAKKKVDRLQKVVQIPPAVLHQRELRKRYKYVHRIVTNGNVENNSTLYVSTALAHPHQLKQLFEEVVLKARSMPQIFGPGFECDVQNNLVRKHTGQYMGYAFVDLDNPMLYYALIGCNLDGSDRVEYVPDPTWVPPKISGTPSPSLSWADEEDEDLGQRLAPPMIRRELPPLLTLGRYAYDEQQLQYVKSQLHKDETEGKVTVSPAFITPGVDVEYDDATLYVSEVPAIDYDFLYSIFSRYARYTGSDEDEHKFYPKITIRKNEEKLFAIVKYHHPYDVKFAVNMLKTIRANYKGVDVNMSVRPAFKDKH